jgi:hypothetical protein
MPRGSANGTNKTGLKQTPSLELYWIALTLKHKMAISDTMIKAWYDFKDWLSRSTLNKLAFVWLVIVIIDGAMLFLCMVGWLVLVMTKEQIDHWTETTSQIMNLLFTGMAVCNHFLVPWPGGRLYLGWLYTFNYGKLVHKYNQYYADIEYCNLGIVILLLNINCFAQYPMAYFMWHYGPGDRPMLGVVIPLVTSFGAGILAAIWEATSKVEDITISSHTNSALNVSLNPKWGHVNNDSNAV